jgi:hypothetical protein
VTDTQVYFVTVSLLATLASLPLVALAGVVLGLSMGWRMANGQKPVPRILPARKAVEPEPPAHRLPPPPKARV